MPGLGVLASVDVVGTDLPRSQDVLTQEALGFVAQLHRAFDVRRRDLLEQRRQRQRSLDHGAVPEFLPETERIRTSSWSIAPVPVQLRAHRTEPRGPAEEGSIANGLTCGAPVFVVDFEDSLVPTWRNIIGGQANLRAAVRSARDVILSVRPRGWHLVDRHIRVDGAPMSGALLDFGLSFFHNAHAQIESGRVPYFSLPKLEGHLEARLWNDVFVLAQEALAVEPGSIRAMALIETIPAAFEMDEILFELRDHAVGLAAGPRDYTFSFIRSFWNRPELVLPCRSAITPAAPFISACCDLLLETCARRGARAFVKGGSRNAEAGQRIVAARDLLDPRVPGGLIGRASVENDVSVALRYLAAWLDGTGAVVIDGEVADIATAEVCRAQLWQWLHHEVPLADGGTMTAQVYRDARAASLSALRRGRHDGARTMEHAADLLDALVLDSDFPPHITWQADCPASIDA